MRVCTQHSLYMLLNLLGNQTETKKSINLPIQVYISFSDLRTLIFWMFTRQLNILISRLHDIGFSTRLIPNFKLFKSVKKSSLVSNVTKNRDKDINNLSLLASPLK